MNMGAGGTAHTQRLTALGVLSGAHVAQAELANASEVVFEIQGLAAATGTVVWRSDYASNTGGSEAPSLVLAVSLPDGYSISADSFCGQTASGAKLVLENKFVFTIRSDYPRPLSAIEEKANYLLILFSVLLARRIDYSIFHVLFDRRGGRVPLLRPSKTTGEAEPFHTHGLVELSLKKGIFQEVIREWFARESVFRRPCAMLAEGWYRNPVLELGFLTATQALESYQRRRDGDRSLFVTAEEYETVRTALVGSIPEKTNKDLRAALKKRLEYGNEWSLRRRLKELMRRFPDGFRSRVLHRKLDEWVEDVVALRNDLVHNADIPKGSDWLYDRLANEIERLRLVLRLLVLEDVGFSLEELGDDFDVQMQLDWLPSHLDGKAAG